MHKLVKTIYTPTLHCVLLYRSGHMDRSGWWWWHCCTAVLRINSLKIAQKIQNIRFRSRAKLLRHMWKWLHFNKSFILRFTFPLIHFVPFSALYYANTVEPNLSGVLLIRHTPMSELLQLLRFHCISLIFLRWIDHPSHANEAFMHFSWIFSSSAFQSNIFGAFYAQSMIYVSYWHTECIRKSMWIQ